MPEKLKHVRYFDTCTGCGACASVCPQDCIKMKVSSDGELHPVVDEKKCADCSLCLKTCPADKQDIFKYPVRCFAAWSRDEENIVFSASGGVGAVFAANEIENDGACFGCDFDEDGRLEHFLLTEENYKRARGSKYSQSSAFKVFRETRDFLKQGRRAVFIGTPCQVAGLRTFLGKEYENLVTVDLVCHGTPPNVYLKKYLRSRSLLPAKKITFRGGEYDKHLAVWNKTGELVYNKHWENDLYYRAFYANVISMNSCYTCRYARAERVSDITIGDFWGLGETNVKPSSDRPSLILINTEKGLKYFDCVKDRLLFEERPVEEGIKGNGRLNNPPGKSTFAASFKRLYPLFGFSVSASFVLWRMKKKPKKVHPSLRSILKKHISCHPRVMNVLQKIHVMKGNDK